MGNNKVSKTFDLIGESFKPDREAMASFIETCFSRDEIRDKAVLDAGCGTGIAAVYFSEMHARESVGIDVSEKSLAEARRQKARSNARNVDFKKADLGKIPFPDGYFDIVFTVGALPYVGDVASCLRELARVLAPGGTMLILSLKKTRWDGLFELFRKLFASLPAGAVLPFSGILATLLKPVGGLFLKRKEMRGGKTLQQTAIEAFFVPDRLKKSDPNEMARFMRELNITPEEIMPPCLNFCSPKTVLVIKGVKKR